jgi:hypothetical protein
MCFVCGPERALDDGLRLFAGPLIRQGTDDGVFSVPWMPAPNLAAADGLTAPEFVWSALDVRQAMYSCMTQRPGASTVCRSCSAASPRIDPRPRPGERCVVTSWRTGNEGRRLFAEAVLFGEEGNVLAVAHAVRVIVNRQVQLGNT